MEPPPDADAAPAAPERRPGASRRDLLAYAGPFFLFVALNVLPGLIRPGAPIPDGTPLWRAAPELWVYPLQTILCAAVLLYYRRDYPPARLPTSLGIFGAVVGLVVFAVWVSPQAMFHADARLDGFDPTRLLGPGADAEHPNALYWAAVALRFVRLVAVVPVLEEIFWRAFLLRWLVRDDFLSLPFGTWTPLSFAVVTVGFVFEHSRPDWPVALVAGLLYNLVAIRTRSLPACVLAHAVTNALLGGYVMYTHQWGFW